jgi:DNA-binding response OmpR family regulator
MTAEGVVSIGESYKKGSVTGSNDRHMNLNIIARQRRNVDFMIPSSGSSYLVIYYDLPKEPVRILLIEDSERLQRALATGLRKVGYAVDVTGDGQEGLWYATHHTYDAIVLDLMLPGLDGISLLKKLREGDGEYANVQVIMLTAKDTVADRVAGLRAGADDYLVKPFAFDELLARIEALTRRQHGTKNPTRTIGELTIDSAARIVWRQGQRIELSAREYSLLEFLVLRLGQVVTRSEIESHLYDEHAEIMSNVIDAAVYSLRKKIDVPEHPSLIQTRRGMGYILTAGLPPTPPQTTEPEPAQTMAAPQEHNQSTH